MVFFRIILVVLKYACCSRQVSVFNGLCIETESYFEMIMWSCIWLKMTMYYKYLKCLIWHWRENGRKCTCDYELKIQAWTKMKVPIFKIDHGFKWSWLRWLVTNNNKVQVIEGRKYGKLTLVYWFAKKLIVDQKSTDAKRWWIGLLWLKCTFKWNHEPIETNSLNEWMWNIEIMSGLDPKWIHDSGWSDLDQMRSMTICSGMWM